MRSAAVLLILSACGPATIVGDTPAGAADDSATPDDTGSPTDSGDTGASDSGGDGGDTDAGDSESLADAVTGEAVLGHLEALQAVADEHDDRRSLGSEGYDASVEYVVGQLEAAGYEIERWPFSYTIWVENELSFEQLSPTATVYDDSDDFAAFSYSGVGTVTPQVQSVE